ncbi:hypothetical protein EI94DRAFT_435261 [Lactarius quietus]|nr:hypothetical protein EI94DRAFT_435261 [Lactarius quietus]
MHTSYFPPSRFQVAVTVLLAVVSLTSAQATLKQDLGVNSTNWECVGCWSDTDPTVRALNTEVTVPGGLANATVENCVGECGSLNFTLAGLEAQTCWCADELTSGSGSGPIHMIYCQTPCTGDSTEFCGGNGALLIYYATS